MKNPVARVHWIEYDLPTYITKYYKIDYNYRYHNYSLMHYEGRTIQSQFIVVRKSKRRFVVVYLFHKDKIFGYCSCENTRQVAKYIKNVYKWECDYTTGKEGIALPLGNRNINYLFYNKEKSNNEK